MRARDYKFLSFLETPKALKMPLRFSGLLGFGTGDSFLPVEFAIMPFRGRDELLRAINRAV